ncbi:aldo/keto reductase [Haloarcula nitratireducens]|uniref:aldo/keto reductase n=1 Tax=Haloarcula nitratireducens TaxID=2487749 RepID=UPI002E2D6847|nr:aldo/keto reductase [Halomicroarcula nitratireducens]
MEYVTSNQLQVPALGLGTYRLNGDVCTETVSRALEMGYRHIDTAEFYRRSKASASGLDPEGEADTNIEQTTPRTIVHSQRTQKTD